MKAVGKNKEPLYMEAKREIMRAIESEKIALDGKLPSEGELSTMLSVSRATVRSALQLLEADGVIFIRHGLGSFVNYSAAVGMRMRIDVAKGFFHLIMDSGHVPSIAKASLKRELLPEEMYRTLQLPEGSEAYVLRRLFLGDGIPAFYVSEYLPLANLTKEPKSADMPESVFQIAEQYCSDAIEYSIMRISAAKADAALQEEMQLKSKDVLLMLRETHYTKDNRPIIYSDIYTNDDMIHFQVRRKKP